ncbi:MAG: protein kinase [Bryobacteraceae bacterium]|jgi:serine/threonine protein kinase
MTPERWHQIKALYHAALEHEPGERGVFLAEACAGDAELRAEVESLLAQDSSKTVALDKPAWAGLASPVGGATPIAPGTQLGPYRIEGPLGEGGMGEVFRGVDTRLGRSVAVKTSREQFSARFDREAKAISSLNHPHICTLYDVGPNYLVMELCDGETLAERLKRGKLSIQETIRYGAQIADALSAAHAKGIVHRDLKPGNVMLTKAGVKVLDFGLAKSPEDETLTASRMVMGTPAYMAPEQREGKECDARTDIYALGLILQEMASGKRTLDNLPDGLAHVIERCLGLDPDQRWQSARDIGAELDWAARPSTSTRPVNGRGKWGWIAAGVATVGLATVALLHFRERQPTPVVPVRFQIQAPENASRLLSLSPDGRKLAFNTADRLWVHSLESGESRDLTASDGTVPFWSPDSRFIGYQSEGKIKRIEVTGGPAETVADLPGTGAWSPDDVIVFSDGSGFFRVPASGGVPVRITALDPARRETAHYGASFLPDGRHFMYIRASADEAKSAIYLGSVDAKPEQQSSKPLVASNWQAEYAPSVDPNIGYLLFMREGTLMAQPFDNRRLELKAQATAVAERVGDNDGGFGGVGAFSASANDVLAFTGSAASQLTWYDREGKVTGTAADTDYVYLVALSPDGTRLAVTKNRGFAAFNIWLLDLSRGGASTRFTFGSLKDNNPVWSPDGNRMIFSSNQDGVFNLYQKPANGVKDEELLLKSSEDKYATSWSRDGRFLLYTVVHPKTKRDIWVLPLIGDRKPVPFLTTEFDERNAHFSPDGHWVAYVSSESGQDKVYVRSFSMNSAGTAVEMGGKWPISNGYGVDPRWRGDGRELYYRSRGGGLLAVEVATNPAFRAGNPQPLGPLNFGNAVSAVAWDSTADGKRFLRLATKSGPQTYNVVLNWQAGLKK